MAAKIIKPRMKIKPKPRDIDLPPEELARKLAPVVDGIDLGSGITAQDIINRIQDSLPPEEVGKWHVTTNENSPAATRIMKDQGYEPCFEPGKGARKQEHFKGDIFWKIPETQYQEYLKNNAYMSKQIRDASLTAKSADDVVRDNSGNRHAIISDESED